MSDVKRVLIIRNSGIGDAICLEPMLREFKKVYPLVELDIFASLGNTEIFKNSLYVDNVFVKHRKRDYLKRVREFFKMKNRKYDLLIDTTNYHPDKALMSFFLKPKWAIATDMLDNLKFDRKQFGFYDRVLSIVKDEHIVDKLLRFLVYLDIKEYDNKMQLHIPENYISDANRYIKNLKAKNIVGINIDAKDKNRTLSSEQLLHICKKLASKDCFVLIFAMDNTREKFNQLVIQNSLKYVYVTPPTPSIYSAIALVKYIDVMISPDTAYIHIASALNIPTVGLFWNNMQKKTEWGPRAKNSVIVSSDIDGDNTLENIDLDFVVEEVKNILKKSQNGI